LNVSIHPFCFLASDVRPSWLGGISAFQRGPNPTLICRFCEPTKSNNYRMGQKSRPIEFTVESSLSKSPNCWPPTSRHSLTRKVRASCTSRNMSNDFITLRPHLVLQFLNISWSAGVNDRLQVAPKEKKI
jgi:hypothetical protein